LKSLLIWVYILVLIVTIYFHLFAPQKDRYCYVITITSTSSEGSSARHHFAVIGFGPSSLRFLSICNDKDSTIKGTENGEERIRISTYQKCIPQYMIFDRLKFLFSVLCSLFLYCAGPLIITSYFFDNFTDYFFFW